MSIEFYCSRCDAYLRAPESKAGLSTNCPHCHSRIWIPLESDVFDEQEESWRSDQFGGLAGNSGFEKFQEFQQRGSNSSPTAGENSEQEVDDVEEFVITPPTPLIASRCQNCNAPLLQTERFCGECGHRAGAPGFSTPDEVDLGRILSDTWVLFVRNWKVCFAVTLVDFFLTIVAVMITLFIGGFSLALFANRPPLGPLVFLVVVSVAFGVQLSMLAVGHLRFYLALCRGQDPEFRSSMNVQGPVGALLFGGIVYWGLFFLILPPIFLWPFGRVVLDQRVSAGRSIRLTLRLSGRHSGVCFALFVIKAGAILISGIVPVLGTLIVTPYVATLNTVAYLHFTGEFE